MNAAMAPGADEVAQAARIVEGAGGSGQAVRVDGRMVDKPVVERAQEVLRRARLFGVPAVPGTGDADGRTS